MKHSSSIIAAGETLTLACSCEAEVMVPLIIMLPRHHVVRILSADNNATRCTIGGEIGSWSGGNRRMEVASSGTFAQRERAIGLSGYTRLAEDRWKCALDVYVTWIYIRQRQQRTNRVANPISAGCALRPDRLAACRSHVPTA